MTKRKIENPKFIILRNTQSIIRILSYGNHLFKRIIWGSKRKVIAVFCKESMIIVGL